MAIPMTPATFNPDNAQMLKHMSGAVPANIQLDLLKEIMANSVMMQLARPIDMQGQQKKKFDVFLNGMVAYWVGEGQRIQTTKLTWGQAELTARKLATIVPVTREFLTYVMSNFFEVMKPAIAQALYTKFDDAVFANLDNPFAQSVKTSAGANMIAGEINIDNYDAMIGGVNDAGFEPNAIVSKIANKTALKGMIRDTNGYKEPLFDKASDTLDSLTVLNLYKDSLVPKGTLYTGDFNQAAYGIPYNMTYDISKEATLTTIQGEDGKDLSLWERGMIAMRVEMDVAFMILSDGAFGGIEAPATPAP